MNDWSDWGDSSKLHFRGVSPESSPERPEEQVKKYARHGSSGNAIRHSSKQQPEEEKDEMDKLKKESEKSTWVLSWYDWCGGRKKIALEVYEDKIMKLMKKVSKKEGVFKFDIHVDGYFRKDKNPGYGAILTDLYWKPILAESKVLPQEERVSAFYHELQGVDLGLGLAIDYGVHSFCFYCTTSDVSEFVEDFLVYRKKCSGCKDKKRSSFCDDCLNSRLPADQRENAALILPLIRDIIKKGTELEETCGLLRFCAASRERNQVADCVGKLGVSNKMTPYEIEDNKKLKDLLFREIEYERKLFYIP